MTSHPIWFQRGLFRSKAYIALPTTAVKILTWFYTKRKLQNKGKRGSPEWVVSNNGEIVFSYIEAKKTYGFTRPRFSRAITHLIEFGFIDIAHHGGGLIGDCTYYSISDRWKLYGTDKFVSKTRPKDMRGLGFTNKKFAKIALKNRKPESKPAHKNVTRTAHKNVTNGPRRRASPANKNVTGKRRRKHMILRALR